MQKGILFLTFDIYKKVTEMQFYIYTHRDLQGNLLYVGKGQGNRDVEQKRTDLWHEGISDPFVVDRICEGLDEDLALFVEMAIIRALDPPLNIQKNSKVISPLDYKQNVINITEPEEIQHPIELEKIKRLKKKIDKNKLTFDEELMIRSGELTTHNKFLTEEQIEMKAIISKKLKNQRRCKEKLQM